MVLFHLAIVKAETNDIVTLPAGGPLERDLITSCTAAIVRRGVGIFKTEKQV